MGCCNRNGNGSLLALLEYPAYPYIRVKYRVAIKIANVNIKALFQAEQ